MKNGTFLKSIDITDKCTKKVPRSVARYFCTAVLPNSENNAIGTGGLGFESWAGQIGTVSPAARHLFGVSSELGCPGAKPRRWAPPLVTRFGVIPRVLYDEDLIVLCK